MADKKQKMTYRELFNKSAEKAGTTKIGDYQEAAGGGTPMKKGQKVSYVADTVEEAHQYRKDHPGAIVRVNQPRDEEGHFTYNSANERELEYGPSRGKTVPPFLKGMKVSFARRTGEGSIILDGKRYKPLVSFKNKNELTKMFQEYVKKDDSFVGKKGSAFGAMADTTTAMGGRVGKNVVSISVTDYPTTLRKVAAAAKSKGVNLKTVGKSFSKRSTTTNSTVPQDTDINKETPPKNTTSVERPVGLQQDNAKKVDYSLAKSNPNQFMKDNYDELSSLSQMAKDKGLKININKLVGAIASGQVKDFDAIRKIIEGSK